jgi:hypothetical protein
VGRLDWGPWLYSLVSGFVGGGAGSIGAGFGGMITDSDHFNVSSPHHLLVLMGYSFLFSGIITVAAYLKQSPLPKAREQWTEEQRQAHRESVAVKGN